MSSITSNPSVVPSLDDFKTAAAQTSLRIKLDQSGQLKRTQFGLGNRILNFVTPKEQRNVQRAQDAAVGNAFSAALEAKFGPLITNNVLRECGIKKGDNFLPLSSWKIQSALNKAAQYEKDPKAMAKATTAAIFSSMNPDKIYNFSNNLDEKPLTAAEIKELRRVTQQTLETAYSNPDTFKIGFNNLDPKIHSLTSAGNWIRCIRESKGFEDQFVSKWGDRSGDNTGWLGDHIKKIKAHKNLSLASNQLIRIANEPPVDGKNQLALACLNDFATTGSLRTFSDREGLKAALHQMANQFDRLSKNPTDSTTKKEFYLAADKVATLLATEEATDKKGKNYGVDVSRPLLYLDAMLTQVEKPLK